MRGRSEESRKRRQFGSELEDEDPSLSAAWRKEIGRRLRDLHDPTRYVIVSAFSRTFLLYYDASRDSYPMNDLGQATLFKRLSVARAVIRVLGDHHVLMKVKLRKDGSIQRVTSARALVAEAEKKRRAERRKHRSSSVV